MELSSLLTTSAWIIPVILAVTLHEAAHGWVAERFGDNTARAQGRVTFNPLKHVDRMGTIIIPGLLLLTKSPILFGYAKPVPVNFGNLKPQRLGIIAVALAGPGINIFLAVVSALLLSFSATKMADMSWFQLNLVNAISINCILAIFNMLPILPLDGGRVLRAILPGEIGDKFAATERYGMIIVLGLIFILPMLGINILMDVLMFMNDRLINGILYITKH